MIRLSYISPSGEQSVEDLVGPIRWGPADYRRAITRRRPGIKILALDRISDDTPPVAISGRPRFQVTLRLPGRPDRTLFIGAQTHSQAVQRALAEAPPGTQVMAVVPHQTNGVRGLTDEQVYEVFGSTESNGALGRRFGRSAEAIRQVRAGLTHAHLRPDDVPPGQPSCHQCIHWASSGCNLEFPDPIELGPRFAVDCAVFISREES